MMSWQSKYVLACNLDELKTKGKEIELFNRKFIPSGKFLNVTKGLTGVPHRLKTLYPPPTSERLRLRNIKDYIKLQGIKKKNW